MILYLVQPKLQYSGFTHTHTQAELCCILIIPCTSCSNKVVPRTKHPKLHEQWCNTDIYAPRWGIRGPSSWVLKIRQANKNVTRQNRRICWVGDPLVLNSGVDAICRKPSQEPISWRPWGGEQKGQLHISKFFGKYVQMIHSLKKALTSRVRRQGNLNQARYRKINVFSTLNRHDGVRWQTFLLYEFYPQEENGASWMADLLWFASQTTKI